MNKRIIIFAFSALAGLTLIADDDTQSSLRQNPEMEQNNIAASASSNIPSYIKANLNRIDFNNADWSALREVFASADTSSATVVHIGDSHLQADMATAVVRDRLSSHFGHSRGRGLIIPFKLAGTNEPNDYSITSSVSFNQSRLLKLPWPTEMGFTGIGISPMARNFDLSITTRQPFDAITLYYTGDTPAITCRDTIIADTVINPASTILCLKEPVCNISFDITASRGFTLHGINAISGDTGVAYHVIGNNGATFSSYSMIGGVGRDIAEFAPDLIILSLGTNEAFGKISDDTFRMQINSLIAELRRANPESAFLLVTPAECQRKVTSYTRRKGRRRRRVKSYAVNTNIKRLRNVIVEYGREHQIPVYDWYEVAGGDGSSAKWIADKTMNTDRVHLTAAGYHLQGQLMSAALINALTDSTSSQAE